MLRFIPPGVKEYQDWQPMWIGDYSYSADYFPIAVNSTMKYG